MFWKRKKKAPKKPSRAALLAEAKANAAKARAEIGEDTLQKVAASLRRKEQSAVEQAKEKIRQMDQDKVIDHLKLMIEDK